eukprot:m51a1_g14274 hypothetical protein (505) ;mRNA; f:350573-352087
MSAGTDAEQRPAAHALCTAWLLRTCLLDSPERWRLDDADLVALALSLPCALSRPCAARLRTPRAALDALVLACARPSPADVDALLFSAPFALARGLPQVTRAACAFAARRCASADPARCERLVRALARDPCCVLWPERECAEHPGGARALFVDACCLDLPATAAVLARGSCASREALRDGLAWACRRGCARVAAELCRPPFSLRAGDLSADALVSVCREGRANVLRVLGGPPYDVARSPVLAAALPAALRAACLGGHTEVVEMLGCAPFLLGSAEAHECDYRGKNALVHAVMGGSASVLRVLAGGSYSMGTSDARHASALSLACTCGCADVVRALGEPPFSLGHADAAHSGALQAACECGSVDVLRALAEPPFCLDHSSASSNNAAALRAACEHGHADVARELGRPPYSLGREDAVVSGCLVAACSSGQAEVVRALAEAPYVLGEGDAHANNSEALRCALLVGHLDVIRALRKDPYRAYAEELEEQQPQDDGDDDDGSAQCAPQ